MQQRPNKPKRPPGVKGAAATAKGTRESSTDLRPDNLVPGERAVKGISHKRQRLARAHDSDVENWSS
ncbi:hypothetical protein E2320_013210 [Naja naja]|nr:hypothetical protein E2320_013210 [Naja naja]